MIDESALLESKTLRHGVLDRTDALDKVKALSLLPDGMHVTTAMVASYFEVTERAINRLSQRHRTELAANGLRILRGDDLARFKGDTLSPCPDTYPQPRTSLAVWSRRAVLNVAMLLRDSPVARQIRTYLLDMEYAARTQPPVPAPAPAPDLQAIDDRIGHILGKTVVPLFNTLIATAGEHRQELIALRADIENVERRLSWHHRRVSALEGETSTDAVRTSLQALTWQAFERHVADLLRRDGCTDVTVRKARTDRGIDITATTTSGRTVAVQCKNHTGRARVSSADLQKFAGAAKAVDTADIALFVATCPFTLEAQAIARLSGIILIDRDELEAWTAGARLKNLR
ncbi:restriction endonuclease [Streptomyces sp. Q6]|uniref:Restriction endonuclease n=1 Tax=Streptomyces citrinus TaxID=3118173 RepID=A0ACD5AEU9_9ACTN